VSVATLERPAIATVVIRQDAPAAATDAYVMAHPEGRSYHRRAWLDVIRTAFGHRSTYLTAEAGGAVVGVLPIVCFRSALFGRFAVSMPFLNYGGVLADTSQVERALLERAMEEAKAAGCSHLELRHTRQQFPELSSKRHKVAMELQLEANADLQWAAIDRKVRNQVRKAEKSRLTAEAGGLELLDAFYEVFAHNMRDLGTPVYSLEFFRAVLRTFRDTSRVFIVRFEGRPVAASLVHWCGGTIEVPWASALREFNPFCANIFLYWQMVQFAVAAGFKSFDFGRSTPGEGTFIFKKQWGAEPRPLVWEYWTASGAPVPELNPANPKFDLAIRTWQQLPLWLANALGPSVVRNIP
jgi:FemAB-related protein (PEP-CTERM system-associated)